MKLIDIINKESDKLCNETYVSYRAYLPNGEDFFTGHCVINKAGEIIDSDVYSYSKDDVFVKYEIFQDFDGNNYLCCWYELEWSLNDGGRF